MDFEDEQSASKALEQMDGMLIGENQISVEISNPPKRKEPGSFGAAPSAETAKKSEAVTSSLGSGSVSSRAQPSSSVTTFLPRTQLMNTRKKTLNLK